jgi:hypothetical protein
MVFRKPALPAVGLTPVFEIPPKPPVPPQEPPDGPVLVAFVPAEFAPAVPPFTFVVPALIEGDTNIIMPPSAMRRP